MNRNWASPPSSTPKESAKAALVGLAADRVAVKIITGDNELVTQHIFAQLGLLVTGVLTGAEILQLDDLALAARVEQVNLFCRVAPAQKNRVILALKRRGHVVGYLGDGINDAPSLHSADVGISVDSAVDVAKAAADMILLERDLGSPPCRRAGRTTHLLEHHEIHHDGVPVPISATCSAWPGPRSFSHSFPCCRCRSCSTTSLDI